MVSTTGPYRQRGNECSHANTTFEQVMHLKKKDSDMDSDTASLHDQRIVRHKQQIRTAATACVQIVMHCML